MVLTYTVEVILLLIFLGFLVGIISAIAGIGGGDEFEESFLTIKGKLSKQLPLKILNNLILRYVDIDRAQLELNSKGYGTYNFLNEVEKVFYSWQKAVEKVKIPYVINAFRRGANPVEIYQKIGYNKISAIQHNGITKRLFFNANTEMVLLFLEMNPDISTLEDFKIKYKQGYLRKKDEEH